MRWPAGLMIAEQQHRAATVEYRIQGRRQRGEPAPRGAFRYPHHISVGQRRAMPSVDHIS
jgi:hypothetical protein